MSSRGRPGVRLSLTGLAACAVALTSCSGSTKANPAPSPTADRVVFDDQGGQAVPCLNHQKQQPTPAYTAGTSAVSELELPMLAFYTANGNKAYCDGQPASAVDRVWLMTYVHDGADPAHVRRNLS